MPVFFIDDSDPATADYAPEHPLVHFLCCPWDGNSSVGDVVAGADAPLMIFEQSLEVDVYDHSLPDGFREPYLTGFSTVWLDRSAGYASMMDDLYGRVRALLSAGQIPVIVGGDHSVSLGALKASWDHSEATVVVYDAHLDLRDAWDGNEFSHASVLRRYHEHSGGLIMYVGARDYSREEEEYRAANEDTIVLYQAPQSRSGHTDIALPKKPIWVEIDIDALDAPLCPNTGCPVPGGLSFNALVEHLTVLAEQYTIQGFSLVEVGQHRFDAKVAAHLLHKAAGLAIYSQRGSA